MAKQVSKAEIDRRRLRGAEVTAVPKLIDSPALVAAVEKLAAAQVENAGKQNAALIKAIETLVAAIKSKDFGSGDVAKLITEITGLKQEAVVMHEPADYLLTFERDRRSLIDGTKGLRFTAQKRTLN